MERTSIIKEKQNLIDFAIQHTGSIESLFEVAKLNGISITDAPNYGSTLKLPTAQNNPLVVDYFNDKNITLATVGLADDLMLEGIDYWAIETEFTVT